MKIAVCLSGQPRSIEYALKSTLSYFSEGKSGYQIDFFCHVWDYNTWKLVNLEIAAPEVVPHDWLKDKISKFSPKAYVIGSAGDELPTNKDLGIYYLSMLYSAMRSNFLKREYEDLHNFKYDCVFKIRYDFVFPNNMHLSINHPIPERSLFFPHCDRMPLEYNRINASDCLYYGDSWGMDIASDLYRYTLQKKSELHRADDFDRTGPGTLMSNYLNNKSVLITRSPLGIQETLYRKEVLGHDPTSALGYNTIVDMHNRFYLNDRF